MWSAYAEAVGGDRLRPGDGSGAGAVRQDWSECAVPQASEDACVERTIKRGEARGTTPAEMCFMADSENDVL